MALLLPFGLARTQETQATAGNQRPLSTILSDLPRETIEALRERPELLQPDTSSQRKLDAVFAVSTPYRFENGPLLVETDPRWFTTLPPGGDDAAILELRRWPGDSVMSLYALPALAAGDRPGEPPLPDAELTRLEESDPVEDAWEGVVDTPAGVRPVLWLERRVGDGVPRLGGLLMPGDAGFGAPGIAGITEEMLAVWRRVKVREAAWKIRTPVPGGRVVRLPATLDVSGTIRESDAPWQVVRGTGFTMGLPPGFRARRMDGGVPPPRAIEGGLLWFRGRSVDIEDQPVAVGDENRFGYVASVPPSAEWSSGRATPLALRGRQTERIASEPFVLAAERTGADSVSVERWQEPGFDGEWLVFRLVRPETAYEIGMPVIAGRSSLALYWIAATWREEGQAPAPPPVDPAERFGIKFERLTRSGRQQQPWVEGYLSTPDLQAEVSRGLSPAASLRSNDGYPVRFVTESGAEIGTLTRLAPEDVAEGLGFNEGLEELPKPRRHRAVRVIRDASGSYLFVAPEGHGMLFEYTASGSDAATEEEREKRLELWNLMMRSVRLLPSGSG